MSVRIHSLSEQHNCHREDQAETESVAAQSKHKKVAPLSGSGSNAIWVELQRKQKKRE